MELHNGEQIILGERIYTYENINGVDTLKRFNEKRKMWITLSFSNKELGVEEELLELLSDEYLHQIALDI